MAETQITSGMEDDPNTVIFSIPISKAGKNFPITQGFMADLSQEVFQEIVAAGLHHFLTKGMSGIKVKDLDEDELAEAKVEAWKQAEANLEALASGKLRKNRKAAAGKLPREVKTEAIRLAKAEIKAAYKQGGAKLPGKASELTELAERYLAEHRPDIVEKVLAEYNARKAKEAEGIGKIEVTGFLAEAIAKADPVKPRVPPARKSKASPETVVAGKATAKGKQAGKGKHVN